MSSNPAKMALRQQIKQLLKTMTPIDRDQQSSVIANKVLSSAAFQQSNRISIYLSTSVEVDTKFLLQEIFRLNKKVCCTICLNILACEINMSFLCELYRRLCRAMSAKA